MPTLESRGHPAEFFVRARGVSRARRQPGLESGGDRDKLSQAEDAPTQQANIQQKPAEMARARAGDWGLGGCLKKQACINM